MMYANGATQAISIHAPRTGSDISKESARKFMRISIHAPRTGSDNTLTIDKISTLLFQSTLPARGATTATTVMQPANYISIHAPRTGSDSISVYCFICIKISIHAPRTGSDRGRG